MYITLYLNIFSFKDNVFSFRSTSPLQSTNVVVLDYIVDGQLVTQLNEGETVSLNFVKKVKAKKNKVSGNNHIFCYSCILHYLKKPCKF